MTAPATYLAAGDYESALLVGLCEYLAAQVPAWTFGDTLGSVQIAAGFVPDAPDRVVVVDTYGDGFQDPTEALGSVLVQLRFRSRRDQPLDCKGLSAAAFNVLHGATDLTIGGLHCPTIYRDTHANLGRDGTTRRWERTDNYTITVDLPSTINRQ